VIGKNELVVLDLGAILGHYCSDLTRTVYTGKASRRIQKWHQAILEAESAACRHALPGKAAQEVDAAARRVLRRAGLDRHFVHGTGHGLGLEVHEAPRIAKGQQSRLRPNMVITIEPGVYVEGFGGIRVEDDLVITRSGNEFLTDAPRLLQEL
jgi:Xaa-Pro aminopeptidase